MPPFPIRLPAPSRLHQLLARVTESLAQELATPGTPPPSDWGRTEWFLARAVAVMQGISPLLASRSRWSGYGGWTGFLQAQRTHTAVRHQRLAETLQRLDVQASSAGIALVALKGVELHRRGLYAPGERPMADIDLLVSAPDYDGAVALLERCGFHGEPEGWKDRVFRPPAVVMAAGLGEHHAHPVKIELHRHIVERLPWDRVTLPCALLPAHPCCGIQPYPSTGSLMLHLLLHAAGTMPTRTLRMVQLHDLGALAARMAHADWQIVLSAAGAGLAWWAYPPLRLAARYYGPLIPAAVLGPLRQACPRRLADTADRSGLFEVSHSYPWVEAFPGLGWSRSWVERVAYMAQRIRPDQATRAQRLKRADAEAWSDAGWSRQSQWRRIGRFLKGPQARPSTLHAVRLALEEAA